MNIYAQQTGRNIKMIGTIISLVAGYDYFLDISKIQSVYDIQQETKSNVWAISKKIHKINAKSLKNQLVLMIHPLRQEYILTRVELVEQEELIDQNELSMFRMIMPQGTFYARINDKAMKKNDLQNIQSLSQIVAVPLFII